MAFLLQASKFYNRHFIGCWAGSFERAEFNGWADRAGAVPRRETAASDPEWPV